MCLCVAKVGKLTCVTPKISIVDYHIKERTLPIKVVKSQVRQCTYVFITRMTKHKFTDYGIPTMYRGVMLYILLLTFSFENRQQ